MRKSRKLALAAILSALGTVLLYLGAVVEVLDLTCVAIASLIVVFAFIEMGGSYPFMIYVATSVISLLILPDKFGALVYLLFAGYYPILKAVFERLHYFVGWVLKLSLFGTSLLVIITLTAYVLKLPDTDLEMTPAVILLGFLTFVLYDIALTKLITFYLVKIRSMLKLKNYFEN